MKRALLDQLAGSHDFAVPPSMVDAEFRQIWSQLEQEAANEADPEAAKAEIENERDEYRTIAERRVRLGLLLSEIGQANGIQVTAQEMDMLIRQAAQQYRESDRERFAQYVRSDPLVAAQLRAPLYEDKVVDFLFDKAEVSEREVSREELEAAIEADAPGHAGHAPVHVHGPDFNHDHDHGHHHHGGAAQDTAATLDPAEPARSEADKAEGATESKGAGSEVTPSKGEGSDDAAAEAAKSTAEA
jgi:trigger factor